MGIAEPINAMGLLSFVDGDEQAIEGPEQSVSKPGVQINFFSLSGFPRCLCQGNTVERTLLITYNQPAFRIEAHCHPGAFGLPWNGVEQFDLKILGDLDVANAEQIRASGRLVLIGVRCGLDCECSSFCKEQNGQ